MFGFRPNIEGYRQWIAAWNNHNEQSGALSTVQTGDGYLYGGGPSATCRTHDLYLDASKDDAMYGYDKLQLPALQCLVCIKF